MIWDKIQKLPFSHCYRVIPCEKSKKNMTDLFFVFDFKSQNIRYFCDKNNFFETFCWFLTIFRFFLGNLNFCENCKILIPNYVLLFFYCLKVSLLKPKVKNTPNFHFFMVLKGSLSCNFTKHIFGVFHYFSHHGQAAFFFAPLLLSVQYLSLTIRCVSWE